MSTILYKCDNCKRSLELIENIHGLTHVGRCSITKNCNGVLYKEARNQNYIRTNIPIAHLYMEDYYPRRLLFKYVISKETPTWVVKHDMGLSCVFIVYDADGNIFEKNDYSLTNDGEIATIRFSSDKRGKVHIISRNDNYLPSMNRIIKPETQISYNKYITFAIPEYISRYDSNADVNVPNTNLMNICRSRIRLEVEVTRPNEPSISCIEELEFNNSSNNLWYGWNKIILRNRKLYCLYSLNLDNLKSLTPMYSVNSVIPDGTTLKITKISYGNSDFYNIPDKGLLILLSKPPFTSTDKVLDKIIDCGEMVDSYYPGFIFNYDNFYTNNENVENTYPPIRKIS